MKLTPTYQKLRGGYYTPKPIADFLAQWAIQAPNTEILEPSCGDGSLVEASIKVLLAKGARHDTIAQLLHAVEIDPDEAAKAVERMRVLGISPRENTIHVGDFFTHCKMQLFGQHFMDVILSEGRKFDVVIGNSPFIRYQNFPEASRNIACEIMQQVHLHPTRLLNAWLPFLIASTLLLKDSGRLAMVIPAELFQVNYAAETRQFLSDFYDQITIVTFKKLVFDDIQQEVVLLLCERNNYQCRGIRTVELEDAEELAKHNHTEFVEDDFKPMDHSREKWTQYFLDADEILLLRTLKSHPNITFSGRVIDVDVGIVTGENKFFVLNVLTFAFAEVTGRGYGGGVLTFEPSEAERLPLPLTGAPNLDLADVDQLLRTKGIEAVLARTDEVLLKAGLGLSSQEVCMLHNIWTKLRDRRVLRKHKK